MIREFSVFLDPMMTIAAAVVAGGIAVAGRRAARRRFFADALRRLPLLLEASPSQVAMLLGTSPHTLQRWHADGVPQASHGDIVRLLRTATVIRECLSPSTTRQLLLLRQRRISDTARDCRDLLVSRRNRAHSPKCVIITVR